MKSEQLRKRHRNEAALLTELHRSGPLRRGELSEILKLRKSSVSNIVADFLSRGVLAEDPPGAARSILRLNGDGRGTVVSHIEAGLLRVATVSFDGQIESEEHITLTENSRPQAILKKLGECLKARLDQHQQQSITGIGVAISGITDAKSGIGIHAVNLPGWNQVQVGQILEKETGYPVSVENDVRCQLLGNIWFRHDIQNSRNALYLSLQKGVASAALVGGKLLRGRRFAAGEIGCLRAGNEGRKCACGKKDCLQTYAAASSLLKTVNTICHHTNVSSLEKLAEFSQSDPAVSAALDHAVSPLIPILASLVSILDPDTVLIATDDPQFSEVLRPMIELQLNRELLGSSIQGIKVIAAGNAEDETLRGMASILIQQAFGNGVPDLE